MDAMPNIATALKKEISRVARKELRSETLALKKAVGLYRREIAALKQRAGALEQQLRSARKAPLPVPPEKDAEPAHSPGRFSAKGLLAQRRRLRLSAAECGLLLGTSSQSIYNWEQGKARPQAKHLQAIAALRTLGKKDAAVVVASRAAGSTAA